MEQKQIFKGYILVVLSAIIFNEKISIFTSSGTALVIAAGIIIALSDARKPKAAK